MTLPDRLGLTSFPLLERYWVQEVIAHGGMSVVYRGQDQRLLRPVCIKVFDGLDAASAPAYTTGHDHFVQEAFALSRLSHPNTVRIYDFGFIEREPALPFQISEWVGGGTLHQRIRKDGALPFDAALSLLEPIAGALAEAHELGIVHRDVKPSNILLHDGHALMPKLADFGIAKAAGHALPHGADTAAIPSSVEGGRILLYSPGWSAPEQLRGEEVTPATDVFSFGLLIGFVLNGRSLLPSGALMRVVAQGGDLDATIANALAESPIPSTVAAIILRACRAEASLRYQAIDDLWIALANLAGAEPSTPEAVEIEITDGAAEVTRDTVAATATVEHATDTFVAGGRVVRVLETNEQVELRHGGAKLRVSLLADAGGELHLHVKGVNCFVARHEGTPTGAVSLERDDTLQLYSPERNLLAVVRCGFGSPGRPGRLFQFGASSVRVPQPAVLIDFEERQELLLIQQAKGA